MQLIIKGKQMDVPTRLRQHIERKVQKLSRLVGSDARVEITISEEQTRSAKDRYSVHLALTNNASPIRSEVSAVNAMTALDIVLDKVATQLGRQKGRQAARRHHTPPLKILALSRAGELTAVEAQQAEEGHEQLEMPSIDEEQNEDIWSKVLEIRRISTRPMDDQEVIAHMDRHKLSYYPFFNVETQSVNVMYRLDQGGYGLLVPALEEVTE
ncbi:MAG TPA: ribosome-associated translation inhibitor RaiA [Ktedonobacteraceae bacterium]|nr:ribosome-associated translation inhibitor RaiA [Ktedonobacteraceae bacterium]